MKPVTFKSNKREDITEIVLGMVKKARETGRNIRGNICGVVLKASPKSDECVILKFFWKKMNKLEEEKNRKEREEEKKREEKQKLLFKEQSSGRQKTDTGDVFFSRSWL